MKLFFMILMICVLTACSNKEPPVSQQENDSQIQMESSDSNMGENAAIPSQDGNMTELKMSDMVIRITSGDSSATFQLYDTEAAKGLYRQLPLKLELENFREAQWMFYPPEKLSVTDSEAYHDGKKGELSYYASWGDVFMLYEDFYAGDEMHRLGVCLDGIDNIAEMSGSVQISAETSENTDGNKQTPETNTDMEENVMKITVGDTTFTATLADNSSAEALKEMLMKGPLTIDMSDYGNMEKVGPIGKNLPENNEQITTEAGDIILYLGNSLVIYYDTNTWNFTRLGKINDVTQAELKEALGNGDVIVTFSID